MTGVYFPSVSGAAKCFSDVPITGQMRALQLLFIVYFGICACANVVRDPTPRISNGFKSHRGMAPWHAGLYTKTTHPYKQICGGTVIAKHVVVTAAHCVTVDHTNVPPVSQFAVAAGKIYRPWNNTHDVGAQKSNVSEIKIPPRYQGPVANFQDDIALLILEKEFKYDSYVYPACLNFVADFDEEQLKDGKSGMVVGWGLTDANAPPSQVLQAATLPCVAIDKCIAQSPVGFRSSITGDKICAGYFNGTAVCRGDSGGGLVFPSMVDGLKRYFLRGVVSTSPASKNSCNTYTWATFTHLLRHEHFVKTYVPDVEEFCAPQLNNGILSRFIGGDRRPKNYNCPCTCPETK